MILPRISLLFIPIGLSFFGCATTNSNPSNPSPRVVDPPPILLLHNPSIVSGGGGTVLLKVNLVLDNPSDILYALQSLGFDGTIQLSDRAINLDSFQGLPTPEQMTETVLNPRSRLEWPITISLPMDQIIQTPVDRSLEEPTLDPLLPIDLRAMVALRDPPGQLKTLECTIQDHIKRIYKPEVTILSIAVKRAELINTRLKVLLAIDNPNDFPVSVSNFSYELYGAGRFWADGSMNDLFTIDAHEQTEKDLFLVMNFINMKRDLLDQVIALRSVQYRFHGDITIQTPLDFLPEFSYSFDHSGVSSVLE